MVVFLALTLGVGAFCTPLGASSTISSKRLEMANNDRTDRIVKIRKVRPCTLLRVDSVTVPPEGNVEDPVFFPGQVLPAAGR